MWLTGTRVCVAARLQVQLVILPSEVREAHRREATSPPAVRGKGAVLSSAAAGFVDNREDETCIASG
jgi:hypothetical protein